MEQKVIKKVKKSPFPYYITGLVWVIYALFFDMYKLSDYMIIIGISIIAFMVSKKIYKDEVEEIVVDIPSGNEQLDQLRQTKKQLVIELESYLNKIESIEIKALIKEIIESLEKIVDYVEEHDMSINKVTKIFEYYIPMLLKGLSSYDQYEEIKQTNQSIEKLLEQIKQSLIMVNNALKEKYLQLNQNQIFDVSSDLAALETLLHQDGLL